jgi:hypothetical protein
MHVDLWALDRTKETNEMGTIYFALAIQQLHALATGGVSNGGVFALFIVTHVVEGSWGRRSSR